MICLFQATFKLSWIVLFSSKFLLSDRVDYIRQAMVFPASYFFLFHLFHVLFAPAIRRIVFCSYSPKVALFYFIFLCLVES